MHWAITKKEKAVNNFSFLEQFLAEKEGFEPSRRYSRPTPLAGAPLRPLEYFSMKPASSVIQLAEREGFEPPVPFGITSFQD